MLKHLPAPKHPTPRRRRSTGTARAAANESLETPATSPRSREVFWLRRWLLAQSWLQEGWEAERRLSFTYGCGTGKCILQGPGKSHFRQPSLPRSLRTQRSPEPSAPSSRGLPAARSDPARGQRADQRCRTSPSWEKAAIPFAKAGETPRRSGNTHGERGSVQGSSSEDKNRRRFAEANLQLARQPGSTRGFSSRPSGRLPGHSGSRSQNVLEAGEDHIPKCLGAREGEITAPNYFIHPWRWPTGSTWKTPVKGKAAPHRGRARTRHGGASARLCCVTTKAGQRSTPRQPAPAPRQGSVGRVRSA